uniref:Uncharacterized protein n=1 Tax=Pelusios castaneus TaxID=367368 RepID=A0A8C8RKG1_9SAUR
FLTSFFILLNIFEDFGADIFWDDICLMLYMCLSALPDLDQPFVLYHNHPSQIQHSFHQYCVILDFGDLIWTKPDGPEPKGEHDLKKTLLLFLCSGGRSPITLFL